MEQLAHYTHKADYSILYSTLLYSTLLYSALLCYTILNYILIIYYTIIYYTILYCTVLCILRRPLGLPGSRQQGQVEREAGVLGTVSNTIDEFAPIRRRSRNIVS